MILIMIPESVNPVDIGWHPASRRSLYMTAGRLALQKCRGAPRGGNVTADHTECDALQTRTPPSARVSEFMKNTSSSRGAFGLGGWARVGV